MKDAISRPGRIEEITSPSNPRIKSIKSLALKKNRDRDLIFLAEGQKLVTDALATGWHVKILLHSKNALEDEHQRGQLEALATKVRARGGDVLITNDKILTSITRRDNAQAVVAVIEQKLMPKEQVIGQEGHCWLALDRVRDPGNLGTIIRTCDALGAQGVILVGESTDPFALEAVRATMGSLFHVPLVKMSEAAFIALAKEWQGKGGQVVGTHLKGAVDHRTLDYGSKPQLVVMGNEQQGLTDAMAAACSHLALIAMAGAADSLNLAVATGIMLFEARRHALTHHDLTHHDMPSLQKSAQGKEN